MPGLRVHHRSRAHGSKWPVTRARMPMRQEGGSISMTARSSLVLEGDVCITGKVKIDGALVIKAAPGSCLFVLTRASTGDSTGDCLNRHKTQTQNTPHRRHLVSVTVETGQPVCRSCSQQQKCRALALLSRNVWPRATLLIDALGLAGARFEGVGWRLGCQERGLVACAGSRQQG